MADERSSGFFFDVGKWKGSTSVRRMSFAEQGVYLAMMLEQWEKKNLPDSAEAVADAIATTDTQRAELLAGWPVVRRKFVTDEKRPGRIFNAPLERTRRQQRANFAKRREAGRIAGEASARKRAERKAVTANESLTVVEPSSTDKTRQDKSKTRKDKDKITQPIRPAYEHYHRRFLERYHAKPEYAPAKDAARMSKLIKKHGAEEVGRRLDGFFDIDDQFIQRSGHTLDLFFAAGTQTKLAVWLAPQRTYEPWVCPHADECSSPTICRNATILNRPLKAKAS